MGRDPLALPRYLAAQFPQARGRASYREVERRLVAHVGDEIGHPLVRLAVRIALDYGFAVSAGNEHQAADLLNRYERIISKLGYDPLA